MPRYHLPKKYPTIQTTVHIMYTNNPGQTISNPLRNLLYHNGYFNVTILNRQIVLSNDSKLLLHVTRRFSAFLMDISSCMCGNSIYLLLVNILQFPTCATAGSQSRTSIRKSNASTARLKRAQQNATSITLRTRREEDALKCNSTRSSELRRVYRKRNASTARLKGAQQNATSATLWTTETKSSGASTGEETRQLHGLEGAQQNATLTTL